jgi:hypothetical protein
MPAVHSPCLTFSENIVRRVCRLICLFSCVFSVSKMLYQYFAERMKLKRVFWSKIPPSIIRTISQISDIVIYKDRCCLSSERFYSLNSKALTVGLGEAFCCYLRCECLQKYFSQTGDRLRAETGGRDKGQMYWIRLWLRKILGLH